MATVKIAKMTAPKVTAPKTKAVKFPTQPGAKAVKAPAALKAMKVPSVKMSAITNPKSTSVIHTTVGAHPGAIQPAL